jgi:O-acetyl-ADP-ribose deacetylase (regulator of RNase III)
MKRGELNDFIKTVIEVNYQEIEGDLIQLAKKGTFDVITHGCNCLSNMGAGIAPQMAKAFGADEFEMEKWGPTIEKLGCIDWQTIVLGKNEVWSLKDYKNNEDDIELTVVNSYTQFSYGKNHTDGVSKPLDYEALTLCMRKINTVFKGKHIGLPKIGAGLAGGDWNRIQKIILAELKDMKVSVVIYKPKK